MPNKATIDIQGHRGARGLFPENTITAFLEAVKLGVNTLELDVVISKDLKVVVSHEPWMNEAFCTRPDGKEVERNSRDKYNLYKMTYAEIAEFDCGKKKNAAFPLQKAVKEHKPLLSEVIIKVDTFAKQNNFPAIKYNIEIKSEPGYDGVFNPQPGQFVKLVCEELKKHNCLSRIILQSFDIRILEEIRNFDKNITISMLVENDGGLEKNLEQLSFMPDIYAPEFNLINADLVKKLKQLKVRLIPWTVNEVNDMKRLIAMGVDGIITDYPDRAVLLRN